MSLDTSKIKQSGFTLIELLVVISIIALLAATGMASFAQTQKRARDAKRISDLDMLVQAVEKYKALENSQYSGDADNTGVRIDPNCSSGIRTDLIDAGIVSEVPGDPRGESTVCDDYSDEAYFYGWDSNHCCNVEECISINRLETQWAVDMLIQKYGAMHSASGGCNANIGENCGNDFDYCFEED